MLQGMELCDGEQTNCKHTRCTNICAQTMIAVVYTEINRKRRREKDGRPQPKPKICVCTHEHATRSVLDTWQRQRRILLWLARPSGVTYNACDEDDHRTPSPHDTCPQSAIAPPSHDMKAIKWKYVPARCSNGFYLLFVFFLLLFS